MDLNTIADLVRRFFGRNFGLEEAQHLLGSVRNDSNPDLLELKPRDPSVEWAGLLMANYRGERFVAAISLRFRSPVPINLREAVKTFGPSKEAPRLHPNQPIPYEFTITGGDFPGSVTLGLAPGKGNDRLLSTVQITRLPPDL